MRSQIDQYQTPQSLEGRHEECLAEFARHLEQAGLADATIVSLSSSARHFLFWLQSQAKELDPVDDKVLLDFRDHDCRCIAGYTGITGGRRRNSGFSRVTMKRITRFVLFLEDAGHTAHPGERQLASDVLKAFLERRAAQGYRAGVRGSHGSMVRHFLDWLHHARTPFNEVDARVVERFLSHDCMCSMYFNTPNRLSCARQYAYVVKRFARFLAEQGLAPGVTATQPKERKLKGFCRWLEQHRGIQAGTIRRYDDDVSSLVADMGTDPSRYDAVSIRQVLLDRFGGVSRDACKKPGGRHAHVPAVPGFHRGLSAGARRGRTHAAAVAAIEAAALPSHAGY